MLVHALLISLFAFYCTVLLREACRTWPIIRNYTFHIKRPLGCDICMSTWANLAALTALYAHAPDSFSFWYCAAPGFTLLLFKLYRNLRPEPKPDLSGLLEKE